MVQTSSSTWTLAASSQRLPASERLAQAGHVVLLLNLFYRHGPCGLFDLKELLSTAQSTDRDGA